MSEPQARRRTSKKSITKIVIAAVICILAAVCIYLTSDDGPFPPPALVASEAFTGSTADSIDSVTLAQKTFPISPPCGNVFAAAHYSEAKTLIIVEQEGVVRVYKEKGQGYSLSDMKTQDYRARTETAYFARIPGLLYLLTTDLVLEERIKRVPNASAYCDKYERIDFSKRPNKYEGIPAMQKFGRILVLEGYYSKQNFLLRKGIKVWLEERPPIDIRLSSGVDEPFRSGPYGPLAQAVFLFPEQGFITKTKKGWALHDLEGEQSADFIEKENSVDYWCAPFHWNGDFYVSGGGPSPNYFLMDTETEELTPFEGRMRTSDSSPGASASLPRSVLDEIDRLHRQWLADDFARNVAANAEKQPDSNVTEAEATP